MTWRPPWTASSALGALDSRGLAESWFAAFKTRLVKNDVPKQYARVAKKIGEEAASRAVIPQLNPLAADVTVRRKLPYAVQFQPSGFGRVGAMAYPPDANGIVYVVVSVPPLSAKRFIEDFHDYVTPQLVHELQHVPQLIGKAAAGAQASPHYESMDRRTRAYKRAYMSDPGEVVAYASQAAGELRAAGIRSIGFPASAEARRASPALALAYRALDIQKPVDAKVLKAYTTKIARFL
jgi:hypothetical protein